MVPQIEKLGSELEPVVFHDSELLGYREVPVLLQWSTESISRHITVSRCARSGRERNIDCRSETINVQISIQTTSNRTGCVELFRRGALPGQGSRSAAGVSEGTTTRAVYHREWQTALVSNDAANTPTLKELVVKEVAIRNRNVVRVGHHKTVWLIEVTNRPVTVREVVQTFAPPRPARVAFSSSVLIEPLTLSMVLDHV